ncbi:MAG: sulfite exporter TauE/SafE family protein [Deltaproteobacteria bacterium]|nr:MAG: sulfite exporter TauE/SafE family protein [Deltaproteobacteria bacterium]
MLSTETIYFVIFTSGLAVGFGHCIGMCGPIVASLSLNLKGRSVLVPHLLYNAGRITTYGLLGGVMGATGSFTLVTAKIASLQKIVLVSAGIIIIVMGLAMAGWLPLGSIFGDHYNPEGLLSRGFRKLSKAKSTATYYPLGMLLGLLPCGPVYTALIAAARAGMEVESAIKGSLMGSGLMLSFGLGTVPSLLLVAKLADLGWLRRRDMIYKISSVLMIMVGIYFVIKAIRY